MGSKPLQIMIVDDTKDNRDVVRLALRTFQNITMTEAVNGQEAVDKMRQNPAEIVLMDIMMPEMNGIDATRIIKQEFPETVVLAITALSDAKSEEIMLSLGVNAYINKPINQKLLRYRVQGFIRMFEARCNACGPLNPMFGTNPFATEVRCFKTQFYIRNEENIMDFGTWVLDYYERYNDGSTFRFSAILDAMYMVLHAIISKKERTVVLIEEDFENLYVSIVLPSQSVSIPSNLFADITQECQQVQGHLYLRIPFRETRTDSSPYQQNEIRQLNEEQVGLLRQSCADRGVSAREYMAELGEDVPDQIYDIKEYLDEWAQSLREYKSDQDLSHLLSVTESVQKIAASMSLLYEFMALEYALLSLGKLLEETELELLESSQKQMVEQMLENIFNDLNKWWHNVFVTQEATNIHYLDSSLYSSCMQIEMLLGQKLQNGTSEEVEFF